MKSAGPAITRVPSAARIAYTSIWNLCSTAGWAADPGEPRLSRRSTLGMLPRIRHDADEGHHMGLAKYRARLHLRASSAMRAKLLADYVKRNEAVSDVTPSRLPGPLGGGKERAYEIAQVGDRRMCRVE